MGFPPGQFSGSLSSSSSFLRPRCGKCSSGGYCSAIWVGDRVEGGAGAAVGGGGGSGGGVEGGAGAAVGVEVGSVVEVEDSGDSAAVHLVGEARVEAGSKLQDLR